MKQSGKPFISLQGDLLFSNFKTSSSDRDYHRKYYQQRLRRGICSRCGKKSLPNLSRCADCREIQNSRMRDKVARRRTEGRCLQCERFAVFGFKHCIVCKARVVNFRRWERAWVFSYYDNKCAKCGETDWRCLSIDHVNGGGRRHKKQEGFDSIYRWLLQQGFPQGFQLLCMNCQWKKR